METHESNDLRMVWEAGSNWRSPAALTSTLLSLFQTIPNLEMVMTSSLTEKSNGIRSQDAMLLNEEVILPCGAVSPNRLFKVRNRIGFLEDESIKALSTLISSFSLLMMTGADGRNVSNSRRWKSKWTSSQSL